MEKEICNVICVEKEQNKNAAPWIGQQKLTIRGAAWYDGCTPKGVRKRRCYIDGG